MSSAPPFRLPGTHFIGVLVSLLLGAGGLVVIAPDLAAAQFLNPRVFAVTHLFTLGVIVTAVFGALYQFYPMSLGAGARSVRVGVAVPGSGGGNLRSRQPDGGQSSLRWAASRGTCCRTGAG